MRKCLEELRLENPDYSKAAACFATIKTTTWSAEITEDRSGNDRELLLAILGLKDNPQMPAEQGAIKKAYRLLSLRFHPDKVKGVDSAIFPMIQTAYDVLSKTTLVLSIDQAYKDVVNDFSEDSLVSEDLINAFNKAFSLDVLKLTKSSGEYAFLVTRAAAQKDDAIEVFIQGYFQREAVAFLDPKLLKLLKKYTTEHPEFCLIDLILTLLPNFNRYFLYRFLKILPEFEEAFGEALFLEIFPNFVEYIENTSVSSGILFAQLIPSLDEKLKSKLPTIFKNTPEKSDLTLPYVYFIEHLNRLPWLLTEDQLITKIIDIAHQNPIAARLMISTLSKIKTLMGHNAYLFDVFIEIKNVDTRHLLLEILSLATKKLQDNSTLKKIVFLFFQYLDKRSILYNTLKVIRELPDDLVTEENLVFCYELLQNDQNNFKLFTLENATAFLPLLSQEQAMAIWKTISEGIKQEDAKTQTKILVFVTQLKKLAQLYSPELFQRIVAKVNFDDLDQNKMILLLPLLQDLIPEEFKQDIDKLLDPKSQDITKYNYTLVRAITNQDWENTGIKDPSQLEQWLLDALKKELAETKEVEKVIGLIKKIFLDHPDSYRVVVNPLIEILFFLRWHNRSPIDESRIAFYKWGIKPDSYVYKLPFYASILSCSLLQQHSAKPIPHCSRYPNYDPYDLICSSFRSNDWIDSASIYGNPNNYQPTKSKNDLVRLLSSIFRHKNLNDIFDYYEPHYFEKEDRTAIAIKMLILALKAQQFSFLRQSHNFIKHGHIDVGILSEWLDMLDIAPDHVSSCAELQAFLTQDRLNYGKSAKNSLSAFKNLLSSPMANDKEASNKLLQCFIQFADSQLKRLFRALTQDPINRILNEDKKLLFLFLEFRDLTAHTGGRDYRAFELLSKLAEELPLNLSQNAEHLAAILEYIIKRLKSKKPEDDTFDDYSIIRELRDLTKTVGWGTGVSFSSQMNGRMIFFPGLLIEIMRKYQGDKPYASFYPVANTINALPLKTLQTQILQIEDVIRSNDSQEDAVKALESMKSLTAGPAKPAEVPLARIELPQTTVKKSPTGNNNNETNNVNATPTLAVKVPSKAPINQTKIPLQFILSELFNDKLADSKFAQTEQTLKILFSEKLKNLNQSLSTCKNWYQRQNLKKEIIVVKSMKALTLPAIKELQTIWRTVHNPHERAIKLMRLERKLILQSAESNVNKRIALSIIAAALLIGAIVATIFTCGAFGLIAGFSIALSATLSTALAATSAAAGIVGILCIPAAFFQNNQTNTKYLAASDRTQLINTYHDNYFPLF